MMRKVIFFILLIGGVFARDTEPVKKEVILYSVTDEDYTPERKRSNKRRRKIRKPIKGLR